MSPRSRSSDTTPAPDPDISPRAVADARPGTPPADVPRFVTRGLVIETAARIADAEGFDAMALTRVARELGRHVSSLYTHVDNGEALRREVALLAQRELSERLWRAALARSREDALSAIAHAFRDYLRDRPGRGEALLRHRPTDDEAYRAGAHHMAEPLLATFASYGLGPVRVRLAHRAFSASVRGFVAGEAIGLYGSREEADAAFAEVVGLFLLGLDSGTWPAPREDDPAA